MFFFLGHLSYDAYPPTESHSEGTIPRHSIKHLALSPVVLLLMCLDGMAVKLTHFIS